MKFKLFGIILGLLIFISAGIINIQYLDNLINPDVISKNLIFKSLFDFNNWSYDAFFKKKSDSQSEPDAFLIAIDEESVQEIGRWPWSREIISQISENTLKYGVKSIAYDIIFSEKESDIADQKLSNTLENFNDKLILGTFSDFKIPYTNEAYQDFCLTEAFLITGGSEIVKLKVDLVVDDDNIQYENINFNEPLKLIFNLIQKETESEFLFKNKKQSISELNKYVSNNLKVTKIQRIYNYCNSWLKIDSDKYLQKYESDLIPLYEKIFSKIPSYANLTFDKKIEKFKSSVKSILIPQYVQWLSNIDEIQKASMYTASFVADMDPDGVIRKYPLIYRTGNTLGSSYIPSLALQAFITAKGYQAYIHLSEKNEQKFIDSILIKDTSTGDEKIVAKLPVDSNGRLTINYYGPRYSIPHVSARDLFNNDNPNLMIKTVNGIKEVNKAEFLKDKSAIFGATATAIYDIRNTPVENTFPGPEIHLTILENLFKNSFFKNIQNEIYYAFILFFSYSLIIGMLFIYADLLLATLFLIFTNGILFLVIRNHFNLQIKFELLSSFIIYIFTYYFAFLIYVYFFETRKSQEIKSTFSKYVSKEIVDQILKNQENLQLKGQKMNMTVFFSDIRGFTEFSEKMDPQELSMMLNHYFNPMSETLFNNNGTIDKFIGDAIMALFGAPINYPDHPQKACRAALHCISHLEKLNAQFKTRNWPEISIGIGLNTGVMVAGNIGSDQIQSYTVIGDEVNLASRLEGLTKNYKVKCLIAESTNKAVEGEFLTRLVDNVTVKGKKKPVKIYELLQEKISGKTHPIAEFLFIYNQAIEYYQSKNFKFAFDKFTEFNLVFPNDYLCLLYLERSQHFIENPPDENWDGVFVHKSK